MNAQLIFLPSQISSFALLFIGSTILIGTTLFKSVYKKYNGRKMTFDDLKRSEASTRKIIESAVDCIISMDHRGKIVEFNRAAEKVFGFLSNNVIGKDMADLIIPPSFRNAHRQGLSHFLATAEGPIMNKRIELTALKQDGSEFPVELTVIETSMNGSPLFTAFLRDITERKKIEEEKNKAIRARDDLVAIVSHELKNPLSAIATNTQLIERYLPTGEHLTIIRKSLGRIHGSVHRMTRLTSDLLDITKVETGKLQLVCNENDIALMVSEALESVESAAGEKMIRLERWFSEENLTAFCDRDRIIQVLCNLVGNSIKFSPSKSSILVKVLARDEDIQFFIQDRGQGMSQDQLPKIFDRFWQAKQTAFKGTGLGLPISKAIIEAHGGHIQVESQLGIGTIFRFTLTKASCKDMSYTEIAS